MKVSNSFAEKFQEYQDTLVQVSYVAVIISGLAVILLSPKDIH